MVIVSFLIFSTIFGIRSGAVLNWKRGGKAVLDWKRGGGTVMNWKRGGGTVMNWKRGGEINLIKYLK